MMVYQNLAFLKVIQFQLREEVCSVNPQLPLSNQSDDSSDEIEILPPDCSILTYSDAASDLLQFTAKRGHEKISEDIHLRSVVGFRRLHIETRS